MNVCQRSDMALNYDSFQPCFFETEAEQEFYADTPSPSHDIWKKFELLPTPPRSPKHEAFATDSSLYIVDKLKMVSELLDDDALSQTVISTAGMISWPISLPHLGSTCEGTATTTGNLKSKALIQDCMWSVTVASNGAGGTSSPGAKVVAAVTGARDHDGKARFTQPLNTSTTDVVDINVTTDCVDPMAVFPYPLNDSKTNAVSHGGDYHNLGTETPSDSDDDDEDDEADDDEDDEDDDDEDDDEIDVVTVGNKTACLQRKQILPAAESHSAQVAAMHSYSSQRSEPSVPTHSPIRTHHTYSLTIKHRHKRTASPTLPRLVVKRQRMVDSCELQNALQNRFSSSRLSSRGNDSTDSGGSAANSRVSSDSEECGEGKRAQHNVLERKRRDDLKSSFHRLRDMVPEMHRQERTPKVTILRKAAAHVMHIRAQHRRLELDLEQQRLAQKRLKEQLRSLGVY